MKLKDYLKDNMFSVVSYILLIVVTLILLCVFKTSLILKVNIMIIETVFLLSSLLYNYYRKKSFYDDFFNMLDSLDKKYLINEVIKEPNFIEGKFLKNSLYEINKDMLEHINTYKNEKEEFEEYIETWCHEIKTPIATSKLIIENNLNATTKSIDEEVDKIESFVEQILYYSRSKNVNQDYKIEDVHLEKIVKKVIRNNKKDFIRKQIFIDIKNLDYIVKSDEKWLEFVINQIINNSIKYSRKIEPKLKIYTKREKDNINLIIIDNGIGINEADINKVFNKGFTGDNGRKEYKSTGMGLYLCKKICLDLHHNIKIESIEGRGTKLSLVFPINSLNNII